MAAAYCAASPHAQEAQEAPAPQLELRGGDDGDPASQSADDDENQNEAPEKPKAKPVKKNFTKGGAPTLPALRAYPGAQRLGQRGGPQTPDQREDSPTKPPKPPLTPPPTIAALPPIPAKVRPRADQKPFEPVGVMLGDIEAVAERRRGLRLFLKSRAARWAHEGLGLRDHAKEVSISSRIGRATNCAAA